MPRKPRPKLRPRAAGESRRRQAELLRQAPGWLSVAALLLLFAASTVAPAAVWAGDDAVIASLENGAGDTEVRQRYAAWLEANTGHEEYAPVLERFVALHAHPVEAAEAVLRYAPGISDPSVRAEKHAHAAELFELAGRLDRAQQAYIMAYDLSGRTECRSLLRSASLLYDLGRWESAQEQVRELMGTCEDEPTIGAVMVLQARLFAALDRRDEAVALVRRLISRRPPLISAAALYGFHQIAVQLRATDLAQASANRLAREFPDSPEAAMLSEEHSGPVEVPATPSFLLGIESATEVPEGRSGEGAVEHGSGTSSEDHHQVVGIQTGSFRQEANAIRQRDRLEALGFRVALVQPNEDGNAYYKVVVAVEGKSTERLIIELKEHGFEGFPLY